MKYHEPYDPLTPEQLQRIEDYAAEKGRYWKAALRDDWFHARTGGIMQTLRNTHGPSWLERFRLPEGGEAFYPEED